MLDFIRQKSTSTAVLFIFGIIILVFVFWGFNPGGPSNKRNAVATVNGLSISVEEYENVYKRELEKVKSQAGPGMSAEVLESLGLRQRALDMLINDILIVSEAKAQGKEATDEEVQNQILANPVFQKDGLFNKNYYFEVLRQNRMNSADYEVSLRESLTAQKMWNSVVDRVSLTDDELWKQYESANSRFTFDYVEFSPADFIDETLPSEEELKKYYNDNSFSFTVPTRLKAFYARAGFEEVGKTIKIPEKDILKYYKNNSYEFITEKEVRASHILIKPVDGDIDGAEKLAETLYQRLKAGEDFAKLAKAHSNDPGSGAKGGDLGFFKLGAMVTQFEDAAFALGKGRMSDLVKTSFGFHIIKVTDIKEEGTRPLDEVRGDIKKIFIKVRAASLATKIVETLSTTFEENSDLEILEKSVKDEGLEAFSTEFISENGVEGTLLSDQMLKNATFGLNAGGVSAPVETDDAVYLIKVIERVESHVAPFEDVREAVTKGYKRIKAIESAMEASETALKKVLPNNGEPLEAAIKGGTQKIKTSGEVLREQAFIKEIGLYIGNMDGFFKLTKDSPYYPEVISHNNAYYLFRFLEVKLAGRAGFDADKEAIRAKYLQIKRAKRQNDWINSLREKADITINQDFL